MHRKAGTRIIGIAATLLCSVVPPALLAGTVPEKAAAPNCADLVRRLRDPDATLAQIASIEFARAEAVGMKALYYNDSTLADNVREAARSMATRFVPCVPVAYRGTGGLRLVWTDRVFPDEWYANVPKYRTWPGYAEVERLTFEFTERTFLDPTGLNADDAFWRRMHAQFTDRQIADLAVMVTTWQGRVIRMKVLGTRPRADMAERIERARTDSAAAIGSETLRALSDIERRASQEARKAE